MKPSKPRCALARIIPKPAATEDEIFEMAQRAWHEHEIALVKPEQITDWIERQNLINTANKLYGKRAKNE